MELNLEQRKSELRETFRLSDLQDVRGVEFLRLLRLAHSEGLLGEFLQDIGFLDCQGRLTAQLEPPAVLERQSRSFRDRPPPRGGFGLPSLQRWFGRSS